MHTTLKPDTPAKILGLLLVAFVFPNQLTLAAEQLVPYNAWYSVQISIVKGIMENNLEKNAAGYTGTSFVSPRGLARVFANGAIKGESRFRMLETQLQSDQYHATDTISKKDRVTALHFDWENKHLSGTVSYEIDNKKVEQSVEEPIRDGTFDPISLQYALMYDLMTDNLKEQYILADGDDRKTINVSRLKATRITVPYGDYDVIPVKHQAESSSRVTTFWFAPDLNFLPVRIEQYRGNKRQMVAVLINYRLPPYE